MENLRLRALLWVTSEKVTRLDDSALEKWPSFSRLEPEQLSLQFFSAQIRAADVPIAFHRPSAAASVLTRNFPEIHEILERLGRSLIYLVEIDGKDVGIQANQVLYHPASRLIPRPILPLMINNRSDEFVNIHTLSSSVNRSQLQLDAEALLGQILANAVRMSRQENFKDIKVYWGQDSLGLVPVTDVKCVPFQWPDCSLTCLAGDILPGEESLEVFPGRARIQPDSDLGASEKTFVEAVGYDITAHNLLVFHHRSEAVQLLKHRLGLNDTKEVAAVILEGHTQIQAAKLEVEDLLEEHERKLHIEPARYKLKDHRLMLHLLGDGTCRPVLVATRENAPALEMHGFPGSLNYLRMALAAGLGSSTGDARMIASANRGPKRDRDLKFLRHLGLASLLISECVNFALGRPLLDQSRHEEFATFFHSLAQRMTHIFAKSLDWTMDPPDFEQMISAPVRSFIQALCEQVISDTKGRSLCVYTTDGEFEIENATRGYLLFFDAMLRDLIEVSGAAGFAKARTKAFEEFLGEPEVMDRQDWMVTLSSPEARPLARGGLNERYLLPRFSRPPTTGQNILNLVSPEVGLSFDGKDIESFNFSDFRPEFVLSEISEDAPATDDAIPGQKQSRINWFELHPKFFFRGTEINADQARRLSREGLFEFQGKLYRIQKQDLPSLKRLSQFWESIQSSNSGVLKGKRRKTEETYYRLPTNRTLELLALRASGIKVDGGPRWKEICLFYDNLNTERPPLKMPESFRTDLQPYQSQGVQWLMDLYQLGLGGILADDMGLGKTVTTLGFLENLRIASRMEHCLVVVPTSLTYNWMSEAARFTPELETLIFNPRESELMLDRLKQSPHLMVIVTYGLLQEHSELFQQIHWNAIIFDEAQNLKNIATKRTTSARKLSGTFKICLTGTPLENHFGEFYSLIDLIVSGALGELSGFREKYINPARVLMEDIEDLKLRMRPLLLRRTKSQVMQQLPPKIETTLKLQFEAEQLRIYRDIAASYNEQIRSVIAAQGEARSQLQMLTALLRLRQACSDPASIPGVQYKNDPPKVETLVAALKEITEAGSSALVFTQFLATYDRIRKGLDAAEIPYYDISGSDSRPVRERKLKAFDQHESGCVMLMTLKTGGVGLNLTKANYIFHIEPWWNPAVENQATDRAHRMGQNKTVQVYRYIIRESVEEKIEVLKDIKSKRFDSLFSTSETEQEIGSGGTLLTQKDFEYLLS